MDDRRLTTLLERSYPEAPVPPLERLARRAAVIRRRRRTRRAVCAGAVTAAIVTVAVVVSVPGLDGRSIQTPLRPVPTTFPTRIPDVGKTHAIVVTPSTGLRDGQIVRVSGRFAPPIAAEDSIGVQMCRAGVIPPDVFTDCDPTTGQGARRIPLATMPLRRYPYLVRRTITVGGQPLDCAAPPGCVLYADNAPDRLKGPIHSRYTHTYGVAPLAFDPIAPPLPGPTVTVTPHAGLRDGDAITVRAQQFRPFDWSITNVCVNGTFVCDGVGERQLLVGPDGEPLGHPAGLVRVRLGGRHAPGLPLSGVCGPVRGLELPGPLRCADRLRAGHRGSVPATDPEPRRSLHGRTTGHGDLAGLARLDR